MKTLILCYTLFIHPLPNQIALTSEEYRVWNRDRDEIADAGNIEQSGNSIQIVIVVHYH